MSSATSQIKARTTIRQHPFNSSLARQLVSELDATYEVLYPDIDFDFLHPSQRNRLKMLKPGDDEENGANVGEGSEKDEVVFYVAFTQNSRISSQEDQQTTTSMSDPETGEEVAGCIALRLPHDSHVIPNLPEDKHIGEIKRFYTRPAYRGTGLAQLLLTHLEDEAKDRFGRDMLVLEVGIRQTGAMKVYERAGWSKRETYGEWIGAGVDDGYGGISVCFEKSI